MQVSVRTWNDKSDYRRTNPLGKREAEEKIEIQMALFRGRSSEALRRTPAAGLEALEYGCHRHGRTVNG